MSKTSLKRLDSAATPAAGDVLTYEEQRRLLAGSDAAQRRQLAGRNDLRPEVLYYLASDGDTQVRQAVAGNPTAPPHAELLLAKDIEADVRAELARKIGRLIPGLAPGEQNKAVELSLQALELLAHDQLPRVRGIVAEQLRSSLKAPKDVVLWLAKDLEAIAHAPILEYSPLLSDADLLEVIATGTAHGRLDAIAKRRNLAADVSDAIVATLDVPAVATLLTNRSAQVREDTLDRIIDNAAGIDGWHEPLVMRAELSVRAMRRIAGFVAAALVSRLCQRHDLPDDLARELMDGAQKKLKSGGDSQANSTHKRVRKLFDDGALSEELVASAIEEVDRDFVQHALALRAELSPEVVERVLSSRNAKAVVALAWRAKFSMRLAMRLESKIARIPPPQMLNARNGSDYPLSEHELKKQVEFFADG